MKVISFKNLPSRPPIWQTLTLLLAIDVWGLSDVWRGIFYTLLAIMWIAYIVSVVQNKHVDLFEEKKNEAKRNI